jgi:hypothetical protein
MKVIVFGILFWYPLAGVTWQFLHYLIGLRRLGYDPYYIEDSARWVYDPALNDLSPDARPNIEAVAPVLERFGFSGKWGFRGCYPGGECFGMTESQILALYDEAEAFLNVTGAQELRDEHLTVPHRIYVESDPVAMQIRVAKQESDSIETLRAHTKLFSFGENLGAPDCGVPVAEFDWLPTRQPVVLDLWTPVSEDNGAYTTIATWRNTGKDVHWNGETYYWSKDREFKKLLDLPSRTSATFELAMNPENSAGLLAEHGWRLRDSIDVSRDTERYRRFLRESRGEFTVAKDQNIRLRSGWFSDRSACYLAAGRPVINQETGFSKVLPTGSGLFAFQTAADVVQAIEIIESDYERHRRAALEIAREYFAAEKVIGSLMERAGA